jgi:hypothetical protein
MSTDQLWITLERYRELIINGLDLLSLILVSPELIRIVRPSLKEGPLIISSFRFSHTSLTHSMGLR